MSKLIAVTEEELDNYQLPTAGQYIPFGLVAIRCERDAWIARPADIFNDNLYEPGAYFGVAFSANQGEVVKVSRNPQLDNEPAKFWAVSEVDEP
jgi:hypothetical protein